MRIAIPISLIGALLFTGCAARHAELAVNNPRPVAAGNYETVYHAAIDVLRERGFDINRKDHRFGVITTHPRGAPTLFEPWIGDNTTFDQAAAATLGDQRRIVRVTLEPARGSVDEASALPRPMLSDDLAASEDAESDDTPANALEDTYFVRVEVLLEELQEPVRRLTGGSGRNIFSNLQEVPHEWKARGIKRRYWRPVGRDPYMEGRLLDEILTRAAQPDFESGPADEANFEVAIAPQTAP